jgi:predicted glycosyltransferase
MKKILVYLGHPAHFHLYKNAIINWQVEGHEVMILIKKKDVLENLLQNAGFEYINILKEGRKDSKIGIMLGMLKRTIRLLSYCRKHKPDILTGTSVENSFVGKLLGIPVINANEDDAAVVPLYAKLSYPTADAILNPRVCNSGKWDAKATKYESYQELAYLHPNHFTPDKQVVEKYFSAEKPYFIIRFAKLNAHHDTGIQGINTEIAQRIIDILKPQGDIYITSERALEPQFEQYRIQINPLDMHHVMAFAQIYIGDSQTMAAEAGVLGIPFVRFNDFVGRIGYLEELENHYHLGFGIKTNEVEKLYETVENLVSLPNRGRIFQEKREKMLSEKIDYAQFLTWFVEDFPQSKQQMKENPDYQYRFK